MSEPIDREHRKRDLSEALSTVRRDQIVLSLVAASLTTLGPSTLEARPPDYGALIWNLVQVLNKLEPGALSASTFVSTASGGDEPPADGADAPRIAPPPVEPPVPSDRSC
jgi:hypothetical protein